MHVMFQYVHAIAAFNALMIGAVILCLPTRSKKIAKVFVIWLFFWLINHAISIILIHTDTEITAALQILLIWLFSSFGLLFYLYLGSLIYSQPFFKKQIWSLLPFIICLLLNFDYSSIPETQFISYRIQKSQLDLQDGLAIIFLYIQSLFFFIKSLCLINDYKQNTQDDAETLLSLKLLLCGNFIYWSLTLLSGVIANVIWIKIVCDIVFSVFIFLFGLLHISESKRFSIKTIFSKQNEPENNNNLNNDFTFQVFDMVVEHMQKHKPYLDNEFDLEKLSKQLNLSRHYVSEAVNQCSGKNFYQFINHYRVSWFCECLQVNKSVKIIDLAFESGFASKSTFNLAFKQIMGVTPSQYRKRLFVST